MARFNYGDIVYLKTDLRRGEISGTQKLHQGNRYQVSFPVKVGSGQTKEIHSEAELYTEEEGKKEIEESKTIEE